MTKLIGAIEDAQRLEKEKKDYLALIDDNIISSSTDLNGVITSVSTAFCRMSQYAPQELLGQSYHLLRDPQTSQKFYESLWQTITKNEKWNGEIKNVAKDKTSYWVFASITPIMNSEGIKIGYTAIEQNITDKKIVEELAIRDHLTGLVNRSRLDAIFEYEIPQSLRYKTPLSIIMIDIDYFKSVNDTYGHLVGDLVLQELSAILKIDKREADTVGRWGGEEFLIILPQTDINGARTRAEKIRLATQSHIFASVGSQTVSLGIAQLEQNDTDASFVGRADSALYKAKNMGRNRVMG